jgi:phytoene synthase
LSRDTNFYYSFLVLPPEKRRAIVAVWDFCRAVDDATDEPNAAPEEELTKWRGEVAALFDGRPPETAQGQALAPFIRQFGLPRESLEAIIDGVEMDLGARRYETFADLYEYCIRVASAVGLVCLEIFSYTDPGARQYAVDLGVALQLTNILRDVPEDLRRGRVYIPREDLRANDVTEDDLKKESDDPRGAVQSGKVKSLLRQQAARAREYYARAARELPPADARRLVAAEIMGAVYRAILDRIEQRDYDVFSSVVRVPRPRRALIAATTWAGSLLGR